MGEISNKTLAILVVIAILVSLLSLFVGRARIITVGQAETTTGGVLATVQSNIDIQIKGTPINFGNVVANDRISSNSTCIGAPSCGDVGEIWDSACLRGAGNDECTNAYSGAIVDGIKWLNISSVGQTQTDIEYVANRPLMCKLWAGVGIAGADNTGLQEDSSFQAKVKVTTALRPCDIGFTGIVGQPFAEMTFKDVDLTTSQKIARGCMQNDFFDMHFRIKVPANEPTTVPCPNGINHAVTLTFTGTAT